MGCSPSKSNAIQPISKSDSTNANGSLPENSSATANGASNDKHFTAKGLDKSAPSIQNNFSEHEDQSNSLKENTNAAAANITPGYNDCQHLSQAVSDALQHHGNHECHVSGNQPSLSTPKLPSKIASLRTLRGRPGTESQIEFFKMLDRKIEAGPDYEDN